ncbi:hypothetical protein EDC04DRAFT_2612985 [Pisolithus marmoratus]|nr:hypothetical protein EDC04DRAFT_2612985 [Pisolithus marmoratus]
MYIRVSTLLFLVFTLAAAAPGEYQGPRRRLANTVGATAIQAPLGVTVNPVIGPVLAIGCTAFVGSCTAQTTCCQSGQSFCLYPKTFVLNRWPDTPYLAEVIDGCGDNPIFQKKFSPRKKGTGPGT